MSERVFSDFTTVMIGDRLYNDIYNVWATVSEIHRDEKYPIRVENHAEGIAANIKFDGRELERHKRATWFWREPMVDVPEPPKRKVKKQIKYWICSSIYQVSDPITTRIAAVDNWRRKGYEVLEFTREIEVEE